MTERNQCDAVSRFNGSNEFPADVSHAPPAAEVAVPWTAEYYPASMRRLAPRVREKAIEIANALLAEGMEEGKAIRIGIAKA